jgi:hypothetical protein
LLPLQLHFKLSDDWVHAAATSSHPPRQPPPLLLLLLLPPLRASTTYSFWFVPGSWMLLILATRDYSVGLGGGMYNQLGWKLLPVH